MNKKNYIIGDVHGMYDTLLALLDKIPESSNIYFVGDLIDRGSKSKEVVEFVKSSGYGCVLGNHEDTFIRFFDDYFSGTNFKELQDKWAMWLFYNGGEATLDSYGFWDNPSSKEIEKIKEHLEWIKALPIYIELDIKHKSNLAVVVSHSNISQVWHLRNDSSKFKLFKDTAIRTRDLEHNFNSKIFNIYGHTPTNKYRYWENSIVVDSGCCFAHENLGKLTAYCVEDDSFIVQNRLGKAFNRN